MSLTHNELIAILSVSAIVCLVVGCAFCLAKAAKDIEVTHKMVSPPPIPFKSPLINHRLGIKLLKQKHEKENLESNRMRK
jgi:hypothetical protein